VRGPTWGVEVGQVSGEDPVDENRLVSITVNRSVSMRKPDARAQVETDRFPTRRRLMTSARAGIKADTPTGLVAPTVAILLDAEDVR
jgi:hypothetical protein